MRGGGAYTWGQGVRASAMTRLRPSRRVGGSAVVPAPERRTTRRPLRQAALVRNARQDRCRAPLQRRKPRTRPSPRTPRSIRAFLTPPVRRRSDRTRMTAGTVDVCTRDSRKPGDRGNVSRDVSSEQRFRDHCPLDEVRRRRFGQVSRSRTETSRTARLTILKRRGAVLESADGRH